MTGILAVGAIRVLPTHAQDSGSYPQVVQRIAEHFGLNQDEVAEVFEEVHAEHHAEMLTSFEDRLSEAVENGDITEDQKQAILDKHEEMQAKMDEIRSQDLSREQMHDQMKAYHEELKAWAENEGIDIPFMNLKFGGNGHGDRMKFMHKLN